MLAEMRIQDLGVIEDALLELHSGFTVVTGETGAGKTMVVSGLHLLSGGRSDASKVRAGSARASVEGRFQLTRASQAHQVLTETGADTDEDGSVIALRSVGADGRSRAHLGGRSVPVGTLAELSEQMLAVHGQNDQLRLLRAAEQRAVLDRFAGQRVAVPLGDYRTAREQWLAVSAQLQERASHSRELAQQADLLRHGIAEIDAVEPVAGEDVELTEEIKRLTDVDELRSIATAADGAVSGNPEAAEGARGALELLAEARRGLGSSTDPRLRDLDGRLAEVEVLLGDVGSELGEYLDSLEADPQRLERALARQAELKALTRKYAADVDGVLDWARDARERLASMDTSEEALAELEQRKKELAQRVAGHAHELSQARTKAAAEFAETVTAELSGLAMGEAGVECTVTAHPAADNDAHALLVNGTWVHAGADGIDDVEFGLRAHQGAQPLPVHKAASGGELSRVMLAIEVVLASADTVDTLVFDEVDAGVGGRAAVEIGKRLARLARTHQVLVVTHLPQVAAFADQHLVVDKDTSGERVTRSGVAVLAHDDRAGELARMLAGMGATETGLAHAQELLRTAEADKKGAEAGNPPPAGGKPRKGKTRSTRRA